MFLDFYQLREHPFGMTPDPRYLYLTRTHREALASLTYGIEAGRGFTALIGKPGMGKTTLLFQLLEQWGTSARVIHLCQTQCDSRELLRFMLSKLGVDSREEDLLRMHTQLKELLLRAAKAGQRVVLVIDEAQNLDDSMLEAVRLLSDLETSTSKLLQIVLAGQPELANKLARPDLVQLRQRIGILSRLEPLSSEETDAYIEHRLWVAGYKGTSIFTSAARAMIAERSEGIPRNINNLCFNALSLGYALNQRTIDVPIIREAVDDLSVESPVPQQKLDHEPISTRSQADSHSSKPPIRRLALKQLPAFTTWLIGLLVLFGLIPIFFISRPSRTSPAVQNSLKLAPDEEDGLAPTRGNPSDTLTVRVEPRQCLEKISRRYLGQCNPKLIEEILRLNPGLRDPHRLKIGQRIRLPIRHRLAKTDYLVTQEAKSISFPENKK